jgi:N-acetylglutamate synthase-like GNAT family acetyltransferase
MSDAGSREGVVVREAAAVDAGAIRLLLRELHGDAAEVATLPVVRQQARTFVAADGDDVVGVVVATFVDYGHEPYGMVEELVVAPDRRAAGTGAALLGECRQWLTGLGAEVVFVSAVSDEAAEFYLAAGFQRCAGPWLWAG